MIDVEIRSLPDYLEQVFVNKQEGFYHEVAGSRAMLRGQANYGGAVSRCTQDSI